MNNLARAALLMAALLGLAATPAAAQFTPGQEGSGAVAGSDGRGPGGPPTTLDVQSTGAGSANLRLDNVNVNFQDGLPDGMQAFWTDADTSDSSRTANIVAVAGHEQAFGRYKACVRGLGADWSTIICAPGPVGSTLSIPLTVPAGRKATFGLVPTLEGPDGPLWVTHPDNARYMLPCGERQVMATMLTVDGGVVRIADQAEVDQFIAGGNRFWCPG